MNHKHDRYFFLHRNGRVLVVEGSTHRWSLNRNERTEWGSRALALEFADLNRIDPGMLRVERVRN